MRPARPSSSNAQAAAFALFEALRHAQGLAIAPDGSCRLTFARQIDPAASGLAWTNAGDDALQLRWGDAPLALGDALWVHATCERSGPQLSLYLDRSRPACQVRFGGSGFLALPDGRFELRERPIFSSHDGRHGEREALVRAIAHAWRVPTAGSWLSAGCWDPNEKAWEPDAARRLVAIALIAEAARVLDPNFLSGR